MNLVDVLQLKFPNADFITEIQLRDQGNGIELYGWNLDHPRPTENEINKWLSDPDLIRLFQYKKNAELNKPIYDQLEQLDLKSIRAIRSNDSGKINELEQQAVLLRQQLLPTHD